MLSLKDRLIGAVVRLFSVLYTVKPAVQRIPVRNHISIQRRRK